MMLYQIDPFSKRLSNNSDTSGFVWEQFDFEVCESLSVGRHVWAVFTLLSFVLGFPACIAILWEIFKTYKRGTPFTPNDFFILNLCIMDIVFLAFIPLGFLNHFIWKNWPLEATWNCTYAFSTCGRPLLMACVCLDCYLAVVHPITYHKKKGLTPRVVMAGIVWIFTVVYGIVYFLFYRLYFSIFSTIPFVIYMALIGICDTFIFHTLIKLGHGKRSIHPQKKRAIRTLVNSLVMIGIFFFPPILLFAIGRPLMSLGTFICTIGFTISITSSFGSAFIPILHISTCGKFDYLRVGCCKKS